MGLSPFHLAIAVRDIAEAREFYGGVLGCREGRSAEHWVDFDFHGHQLVCHLNPEIGSGGTLQLHTNPVDRHSVPVPHFGVVLEMEAWKILAERLRNQGISFLIEPSIRFQGQAGEQATLFFLDPSGNALEFKAFRDISGQLFDRGDRKPNPSPAF
ncbi:MAG: VOC family protein [Gammaproteobacteria bacterium]